MLLLSLKAVLLLFLLSHSILLILLFHLLFFCGGAGVVSVVDDVFRVWSRRTEILLWENLLEDELRLNTNEFAVM